MLFGGLLHTISADIKEMILAALLIGGRMWRSPRGLTARAWISANPVLFAGSVVTVLFVMTVLLPIANGIAMFHAGGQTFSLLDGIIAVALVAFWQRYRDGKTVKLPAGATINGTAHTITDKVRELTKR